MAVNPKEYGNEADCGRIFVNELRNIRKQLMIGGVRPEIRTPNEPVTHHGYRPLSHDDECQYTQTRMLFFLLFNFSQ
jgi:hypothetical protein